MGYEEFGYEDGKEFPYKADDEFTGTPTQVSRFMRMVHSQGGQVSIDGNTVRITSLPEEEKKAAPKKAAETKKAASEDAPVEEAPKKAAPKKAEEPAKE